MYKSVSQSVIQSVFQPERLSGSSLALSQPVSHSISKLGNRLVIYCMKEHVKQISEISSKILTEGKYDKND